MPSEWDKLWEGWGTAYYNHPPMHEVRAAGDKLQAENNALHDLNASQFQEIGRCMKIERKLEAVRKILAEDMVCCFCDQGITEKLEVALGGKSANNGGGGTQ